MIGQLVGDRYQVEARLGQGGMGAVYRATDLIEERPVALKVLHHFLDMDSEVALSRFHREFRILAQLDHPGIMRAYQFGMVEGVPYLVLEYLAGQTLKETLGSGPLERERLLHIARQIGEALVYLHARSIVHRDLKPGNVMLLPSNDTPRTKLMDFGLVRQADLSMQLTQEGVALGTVTYMAPEQGHGQPVDFRADLYALGVILYEMASGRPPFVHEHPAVILMQQLTVSPPSPRQFNPDLDEALEALILQLLAKEPADRPNSTELVVSRLAQLADETVPAVAPVPSRVDLIPRVPLIGRQASYDQLNRAWLKAQQGKGQLVFLTGAAGAGKSRLLAEFSLQVRIGGGQTVTGHCQERTSLPYQAIVDILERLLKELPEPVKAALPAELGQLVPSLAGANPLQPENTGQAEARRRLFAACWELIRQAAQRQTVMLVIEDGQWADPATLELLDYLAARLGQIALLLVLPYRPEEVDSGGPLRGLQNNLTRNQLAKTISLGLLSQTQVAEFLAAALGQPRVADWVTDGFYWATEGNPLFLEETLKALASEGQVAGWLHESNQSRWIKLPGSSFQLPKTVLSLAERRLQLLSSEDRTILTTAAVLGAEFSFALLEEVSQLDEDSLLDTIDRLLAAELIDELPLRDGEDRFRFRQEALRQALVNSLSQRRLRRLHQAAGAAIRKVCDSEQRRYWPVLAYHFVEAGDIELGLKYSVLAGDEAARVYANVEAVAHYSRGLDIAQRGQATSEQLIHLYRQRGRALELDNQYDAALANYQQMVTEAEQVDDPALKLAGLLAMGVLYGTPTPLLDAEKGRETSEQGLALACEQGDRPAEAKALWTLMLVNLFGTGEFEQARQYGEASLEIARELKLEEQLAYTLNDLRLVYSFLGDLRQARAASDEAERYWRALGNMPMLSDSLNVSALLCCLTGEFDQGIEAAREGYEVALAINNIWNQIAVRSNIIWAHRERGDYGIVIQSLEEAIQLGQDTALEKNILGPKLYLAQVWVELGLVERARALCDQVAGHVDNLPPIWRIDDQLATTRASLELISGNSPAAQAALEQSRFSISDVPSFTVVGLVGPVVMCEIAMAVAECDRVVGIAAELEAIAQKTGYRYALAEIHYLKGKALLAQGEAEAGLQALVKARSEAEALTARRVWWKILAAMAEVEAQQGNAEAATGLRHEARAILNYVIAQVPAGEARESFATLPEVRAVVA